MINYSHDSLTSESQAQEKLNNHVEQLRPWFYKPKKSMFGVRRNVKYNIHHWDDQENMKYVEFLAKFIDIFKGDIVQKRKYHLYRILSKHIGSRSPVQCRSHHQRMILAHRSPEAIVAHFSASLVLSTSQSTRKQSSQDSCLKENYQLLDEKVESCKLVCLDSQVFVVQQENSLFEQNKYYDEIECDIDNWDEMGLGQLHYSFFDQV